MRSLPCHCGESNKDMIYDVAAAYTLDKVGFIGTYDYREDTDTDNAVVNSLALEVDYNFTSNFYAYIDYNINMLDTDDSSSVNTVTKADTLDDYVLGAKYTF